LDLIIHIYNRFVGKSTYTCLELDKHSKLMYPKTKQTILSTQKRVANEGKKKKEEATNVMKHTQMSIQPPGRETGAWLVDSLTWQ
jgi:hypothetical protein